MAPARSRPSLAAALLIGVALTGAACGSSSSKTATTAAPSTAAPSTAAPATAGPGGAPAAGSGPVDVLYAGSLVAAMTKQVGPGFDKATGYSFTGFSGDSGSLATDIKGKVRLGDVFISANPKVNAKLEGAANGSWVSWYAQFATSPLVLGYNPSSKFAADVKAKPWYEVLQEPGILIGRTDPTTDPKGALAVAALDAAATTDHEPALAAVATSTADVYPENTLVGRLMAGQLDVGFFYAAEAKAAGIPTVPIDGATYEAKYTITILAGAPHLAGAEAFVDYLVGSGAAPLLRADGFVPTTPPAVTGTGVPSAVQGVLSGQ